jgi:hypothetical protein
LFTTSLNCDVFCAGAWLIPEDHTNDTPSYKNFSSCKRGLFVSLDLDSSTERVP